MTVSNYFLTALTLVQELTQFTDTENNMIIHDNGTEREMTESEIAELQEAQKLVAKDRAVAAKIVADKAVAKQAVLDKLGLTADEVTALLG